MSIVPISQLPNGGSLQATDMIHVSRGTSVGSDYRVTTTPYIPPPGIITAQEFFTSGTSGQVYQTGIFVGWASSVASTKNLTIPASTGSLGRIIVSDMNGSASAYPIFVTPVTGAIIGVNGVYSSYGSITLMDTAMGWASI